MTGTKQMVYLAQQTSISEVKEDDSTHEPLTHTQHTHTHTHTCLSEAQLLH